MKFDSRVREYIVPKKVVLSEGVDNAEKVLCQADQIGLMEKEYAVVTGKARLILDFGREFHGGIRIVTGFGSDPAKVHIKTGESISEVLSEIGEKGSVNAHTLRDIQTEIPMLSDMEMFNTGLRFVSIETTDPETKMTLKSVNGVYIHNSRERVGEFKCSDPVVNKIYDTAAYTVELCAQDYLWDGIKRDRLVWIGDIYPEMRALLSVCNDDGCITKSLDYAKNETPLPGWMDTIPMYSMWWLIILVDYYKITGNLEYIQKQSEYAEGLIGQIDRCINDDGSFDFGYDFLDWPTHEQPDEKEGVRNLTKLFAEKAEIIEELCGMSNRKAKGIKEKLCKASVPVQDKKQVIAIKYFADKNLSDGEKKLLLKDGAKGLSTFMSYFILTAVSRNSDVQTAIGIMKEYYGGMLKMGATTFWEDFDVDWLENSFGIDEMPSEGKRDIHGDFGKYCYLGFRHSLCHGWSAGVIPFMLEEIFGLEILEGGYKKVKISPNLGNLEFASVKIPTPMGILKIDCKKVNGKVQVKINKPDQMEVIS